MRLGTPWGLAQKILAVSALSMLTALGGAAAADDLLPHPYTAEDIRGAMPVGFQLVMETTTPEGSQWNKWTVVEADAEGVTIEYLDLSEDGKAKGEATRQRSTWIELRNHASFPSAHAQRVQSSRETALGKLDGWLYTVKDPKAGTVTEFFFATDYPGAPVHLEIEREGAQMLLMRQLERHLP